MRACPKSIVWLWNNDDPVPLCSHLCAQLSARLRATDVDGGVCDDIVQPRCEPLAHRLRGGKRGDCRQAGPRENGVSSRQATLAEPTHQREC